MMKKCPPSRSAASPMKTAKTCSLSSPASMDTSMKTAKSDKKTGTPRELVTLETKRPMKLPGSPTGGCYVANTTNGVQAGALVYDYRTGTVLDIEPGISQAAMLVERRSPLPGISPGMEYLTDELSVHLTELTELPPIYQHIQSVRHYSIRNEKGHQIYFAYEQSSELGSNRAFKYSILDIDQQTIMILSRRKPSHLPCSKDVVTVELPPGNKIGSIQISRIFGKTRIKMKDFSGVFQYLLSNKLKCPFAADNKYEITEKRETVGELKRNIAGGAKICCGIFYKPELGDIFHLEYADDLMQVEKGWMLAASLVLAAISN